MKIKISSEYSAQSSITRPNPLFLKSVRYILDNGFISKRADSLKIADQGCGKLRHLNILCLCFNTIYLIDTDFQLKRKQTLFGEKTNIKEYVNSLKIAGKNLFVLSDMDFNSSNLGLDIIFNICVFDIELPKTRKAMVSCAYKNLSDDGLYVVIVPRNDQSILVRCTPTNIYSDGHIFNHHGVTTFYKNYIDTRKLIRSFVRQGFVLEADLSIYRQICLILRKGNLSQSSDS